MVEIRHHHATRVALIVLGVLPTLGSAPAQGSSAGRQEKPQEAKPRDSKPQAAAWPTLSKADLAEGQKWLELIGSQKQETRDKAREVLVGLGPGFADRLFLRLTDSSGRDVNEHVVAVLEKILKPEHAALVGQQAKHKSRFARRYVMKKLATWGRPESVAVLEAQRKDPDVEVRYYAALGLARSADKAALDVIFDRCVDGWNELGDEVTRFLAPCRDEKFVPWLQEKLNSPELTGQVTALRLMRSLSPASGKVLVRRFLDSSEALLKKEAINTLRVIVDGQPPMPLDKITVFLIFKMAKEWKQRI